MKKVTGLDFIGIGQYLPRTVVGSEFFTTWPLNEYKADGSIGKVKRLTKKDIVDRCGIEERRVADRVETVEYMAEQAAREALIDAKLNPRDLNGIVVATLTNKRRSPGVAAELQGRLGAKVEIAEDVNNACAGFPAAVRRVHDFVVAENKPGYYLVVASEKLTPFVHMRDWNSYLFGDAAGAAVFKTVEGGIFDKFKRKKGVMGFDSGTNPAGLKWVYVDDQGMLRMPEGKEVFKIAVKEMYDSVEKLRNKIGWQNKDIVIGPHQANGRILDNIRDRIHENYPLDTVVNIVSWLSNTSAATIPVVWNHALRKGIITPQYQKAIFPTIGAGMNWSTF